MNKPYTYRFVSQIGVLTGWMISFREKDVLTFTGSPHDIEAIVSALNTAFVNGFCEGGEHTTKVLEHILGEDVDSDLFC